MERTIIFSQHKFLTNSVGRVCVFAANLPYEVKDLRTDYKNNWIHFSYDGDLFEFVEMDDTKISL